MIKIEADVNSKGNIELSVESRGTDSETLAKLDLIFRAIAGTEPRRGGYTSSNSFVVEVKPDDASTVSF